MPTAWGEGGGQSEHPHTEDVFRDPSIIVEDFEFT